MMISLSVVKVLLCYHSLLFANDKVFNVAEFRIFTDDEMKSKRVHLLKWGKLRSDEKFWDAGSDGDCSECHDSDDVYGYGYEWRKHRYCTVECSVLLKLFQ